MKTESLGIVLASGNVLRCHTLPCLQRQTVGQHTWRTIVLLHWVYDPVYPPARVTYAMTMHDVSEIYTGDIPGDTKAASPALHGVIEIMERDFEERHGLTADPLAPYETDLLHFCDRADLTLYAIDEMEMGNTHLEGMMYAAYHMTLSCAEKLKHYDASIFAHMGRVNKLLDALNNRIDEVRR